MNIYGWITSFGPVIGCDIYLFNLFFLIKHANHQKPLVGNHLLQNNSVALIAICLFFMRNVVTTRMFYI